MGLEQLLSRHDGSYPRSMAQAPVVYDLKMSRENGHSLILEHNLFLCFTFLATDPRDKIYALFGLTTDIEELGINVNYNASVKKVYTDTTIKILNQGTSLSLLNAAGSGRYRNGKPIPNDNNLPSWVPNFSQLHDLDIIAVPAKLANYKTPEATKLTNPQIKFHLAPHNPNSPSLKIRGRFISHISTIYPPKPRCSAHPPHNYAEIQAQAKKELAWLHATMTSASKLDPYPSGVPWRQAYARTLIINKLAPVVPGSETQPTTPCWESLDAFLGAKRWLVRADVEEVRRREVGGEVVRFDGGRRGWRREEVCGGGGGVSETLVLRREVGFWGMRMRGLGWVIGFVSFMGVDAVCCAAGGGGEGRGDEGESLGSRYLLVGECYVDEWMDGEALGMGVEREFTLV
ncbi:hypothetical protein DID88_009152 [Monilinia fructigena]|uniref:Uncharacterized protein n=1 Tax=Monilinia fructigena TaxID=38457 RepID=A0A395IEP9_9HELO|nr:hypothetical protein DID88_009152 [Monilinia fructigena]